MNNLLADDTLNVLARMYYNFSFWKNNPVEVTTTYYISNKCIYITKGGDRFHWAATPLEPHKVGNICYMTYRYSVLYFLNLFLKHFFPHRKQQFLWKYPNLETVIIPCFNVLRMPDQHTSQSKIEDIVHCKCISLLN